MKKEKFERFCMNCGSTSLKMPVMPSKSGTGQLWQNEQKCTDCGFEGMALEGKIGFIKKFRKSMEGK